MNYLVHRAAQSVVNAQINVNRACFEINREDRPGDPAVLRVHLQAALADISEAFDRLTLHNDKRAAEGKPPLVRNRRRA